MVTIDLLNLMKEEVLYSEFQPLMNSSNDQIFAYEALMRTTPRINPLTLIRFARSHGVLYDLDTICIKNAVKDFPFTLYRHHFLFINLLPSTLVHHHFENFINNLMTCFPHIRGRVVFEINEDLAEQEIWSSILFYERLNFLKSQGFHIAFDDLPVARASFEKMESISPDFVKLDHTKSNGLSHSKDKQQLVSLFLEYTNEKMQLVLEGIETERDLITAKELGVPLLQGYYISKPMPLEMLRKAEII